MSIPVHWLTKGLAITGQIYPDDIAAVVAMGFKSVICNRPDNEHEQGQPAATAIEAAAKSQGLSFAWLPVSPQGGSAEDADEMGKLLGSLPAPILSFCKTGGRCMALISNAAQRGHTIPQ